MGDWGGAREDRLVFLFERSIIPVVADRKLFTRF